MSVEGGNRVGKEEEVSGYEVLRRRAVGAVEENGEGHGWSLLIRQGMLAWLRAFAELCSGLAFPQASRVRNGRGVPRPQRGDRPGTDEHGSRWK